MAHDKCRLIFSSDAWLRMLCLVQEVDTEVAWHGCTERLRDGAFFVYNIKVFPQIVSGGFTTTDDTEYWKWVFSQRKDIQLNFHGHSHVNFDAFRSGRDEAYQHSMIESLGKDDYYIFFIINKMSRYDVRVVDKKLGRIWQSDRDEVSIEIEGLNKFLNKAKAQLQPTSKEILVSEDQKSPVSAALEYETENTQDDDWIHMEEFSMNDPFARNEL